jgi:starch phosphorylase
VRILTNAERPVQIIFAGKAHPQDTDGKEMIRRIIHFARQSNVRNSVVFLEDYDINIARYFTQGVDVWLNTPIRPMEASGTSGMKAAANGVPNLSIMDGWWAEGYSPSVGWMLGEHAEPQDPKERDRVDSEALYNMLELEVAPLYYERDRAGVPRKWVRMMKDCLISLASLYNTHRMVREYAERAYLPGYLAYTKLTADKSANARDLAAWRRKVAAGWPGVSVESNVGTTSGHIKVGEKLPVGAKVSLGCLSPDDVHVELVYGLVDPQARITAPVTVCMTPAGTKDGGLLYGAEPVFAQSGQYGFAVRVTPTHDSLLNSLMPPLVTWEK